MSYPGINWRVWGILVEGLYMIEQRTPGFKPGDVGTAAGDRRGSSLKV